MEPGCLFDELEAWLGWVVAKPQPHRQRQRDQTRQQTDPANALLIFTGDGEHDQRRHRRKEQNQAEQMGLDEGHSVHSLGLGTGK